jgi:hypothetical protein
MSTAGVPVVVPAPISGLDANGAKVDIAVPNWSRLEDKSSPLNPVKEFVPVDTLLLGVPTANRLKSSVCRFVALEPIPLALSTGLQNMQFLIDDGFAEFVVYN